MVFKLSDNVNTCQSITQAERIVGECLNGNRQCEHRQFVAMVECLHPYAGHRGRDSDVGESRTVIERAVADSRNPLGQVDGDELSTSLESVFTNIPHR